VCSRGARPSAAATFVFHLVILEPFDILPSTVYVALLGPQLHAYPTNASMPLAKRQSRSCIARAAAHRSICVDILRGLLRCHGAESEYRQSKRTHEKVLHVQR
jgi:hypothetical protein